MCLIVCHLVSRSVFDKQWCYYVHHVIVLLLSTVAVGPAGVQFALFVANAS